MKTRSISTALVMAAVLGLAVGCSSSGGGVFGDDCSPCAPQPVAQAPCAPEPVCAPVCAPVTATQGQRPPDAAPGEVWCYVRVPAVTRTEEERVCVRPETCREVQVPAVTKQVTTRVCVKPESVRQIPIAAEYEDRCKQVCTAPARTEWQRVDCNPTKLAAQEQVGECWTLKEIAPCYRTDTERVCVKPAGCRTEPIAAEYEDRCETVIVQPARVDRIPVQAEYETRYKEVVVCGPRWEWRRTTECEVPNIVNPGAGYADQGYADQGYDAAAPMDDLLPGAAAVGSPDDNVPPAGGLPPLR